MITLTKIEKKYYLPSDRTWYLVSGTIDETDVKKINNYPDKIGLILKNTKSQNSDIIKRLSFPKVKFSVMGGLNYMSKKKYQDIDYVDRTLINPLELSKIIEFFEKIEKGIRYSWTDTQKCMYIYKTIVEYFHYKYDGETSYENNIDVVRSLHGVLYGKLVCSGFALVFKEAMARINIPCLYQNKSGDHSWNIVKLDNKYRGLDVTWDCFNKGKDNTCGFAYFGREENFYQNKHHDISSEKEEQEYPLEVFSDEELIENRNTINQFGNIRKAPMEIIIDSEGNKIYYLNTKTIDNYKEYTILINNNLYTVYTDKNENALTKNNIEHAVKYNNGFIGIQKNHISKNQKLTYKRKDLSMFKLYKLPKQTIPNMYEFYYYDTIEENNKVYFRRCVIISDMDLTMDYHQTIKETIINKLLSKERINIKIEHYNGYVGYIGLNNYQLYYNEIFEQNNLNIYKRY